MPSISFAFGLFIDDALQGVLTIGKPASAPLCFGVCGKENSSKVYELNRLIVNEGLEKNSLSWFVAKCLKMLREQDLIIVSFSDMAMNHNGYIYQATNWIYTGTTNKRTDKYMPGNKHARHYTEEFKHIRKVRSAKHRYIYFTGKSRKTFLSQLNYKVCDYPKGENERYTIGDRIKTEIINTLTGETFYE